jgi:NAD+ synthase
MPPDDLERLRAARIYDPEADDAADQLALLERLETRGLGPEALVSAGFDTALVSGIREKVRRSHYKRVMPLIAKVSLRTIGHDFLYPRDWESD